MYCNWFECDTADQVLAIVNQRISAAREHYVDENCHSEVVFVVHEHYLAIAREVK